MSPPQDWFSHPLPFGQNDCYSNTKLILSQGFCIDLLFPLFLDTCITHSSHLGLYLNVIHLIRHSLAIVGLKKKKKDKITFYPVSISHSTYHDITL